jgi:aspartate/methionine/tyrosine aminotransferase
MTGWRVGFAVGNAELVSGLARLKTNPDFRDVRGDRPRSPRFG